VNSGARRDDSNRARGNKNKNSPHPKLYLVPHLATTDSLSYSGGGGRRRGSKAEKSAAVIVDREEREEE
jgi:hypothetical protein